MEDGFFDLGLTGLDWVQETGAKVEVVAELAFAKVSVGAVARVVLAVAESSGISGPDEIPHGSRVSTEYPNLTKRYFSERGIPVKIFLSYGATEAKVPEIVDAIVDTTETGATLRRHGMKIIDTVLESPALLIANPASYADEGKRKAMEEIRILLAGAVNARGKVLVKMNVGKSELPKVLEVLPSLTAPTVSELSDSGYFAVETVIDKTQINLLIPELKARGASGILELPITKIVD